MGLGNSQRGTYISLSLGKFRVKSDSSNPDAIKRINKNEQEVYELVYDHLDGTVRAVSLIPNEEYGDQFRFDFTDEMGEFFSLFISAGVSANKFINKLVATKPNEHIDIDVFGFADGSKIKTEFNIIQNFIKMKRFYDWEHPDMPKTKKPFAELDKKERMSFGIDMDMFFSGRIMEWVKQIDVTNQEPTGAQPTENDTQAPPPDNIQVPEDDLPF